MTAEYWCKRTRRGPDGSWHLRGSWSRAQPYMFVAAATLLVARVFGLDWLLVVPLAIVAPLLLAPPRRHIHIFPESMLVEVSHTGIMHQYAGYQLQLSCLRLVDRGLKGITRVCDVVADVDGDTMYLMTIGDDTAIAEVRSLLLPSTSPSKKRRKRQRAPRT